MLARQILSASALVVALAAASTAGAATSTHATLTIRHQLHGCHAWSLDGGAYKPTQALVLRHGGTLVVTDDDVMPHTLVETSGPAASMSHPSMARMGAEATITFTRPGSYHFTTKPGEDYMKGVETVGADNVLRLTVTVP